VVPQHHISSSAYHGKATPDFEDFGEPSAAFLRRRLGFFTLLSNTCRQVSLWIQASKAVVVSRLLHTIPGYSKHRPVTDNIRLDRQQKVSNFSNLF
jgi:hypothetical protein